MANRLVYYPTPTDENYVYATAQMRLYYRHAYADGWNKRYRRVKRGKPATVKIVRMGNVYFW